MFRLISTLLLAVCSLWACAAPVDSVVRWKEVVFASDFERDALYSFLHEKNHDFLQLFLANAPSPVDNLERLKKKTQITLNEIRASSNFQKKNDKKIKYIYNLIHQRFFTQYQEEILFYDIIETGKYNCVTATALYAWFFDHLGIPYTIKEKPTHVYLVAFPTSDNIIVESTSPTQGFMTFTPEFKAQYVRNLKEQKLIGLLESSQSVDELFNKYYFGTGDINLTQLVGIHYMNDGLYRHEHNDIRGAYEQFKKAWYFYPGARAEFVISAFLAGVIEGQTLDPVEKAELIATGSRFQANGISSDMIVGEFQSLAQATLIKKNDRELFQKCYERLLAGITDENLIKEINFFYFYENGRVLYNMGNYSSAKSFLTRAFQLQPTNADLSSLVVSCLGRSLTDIQQGKVAVDTLEAYQNKFSMLGQDINFKSMLALSYAMAFGDAYRNGKASEGDRYQKLFEGLLQKEKDIKILSPDLIGLAYSSACTYYFRKGQKARAKQFIDAGLAIVPRNYELLMRRQALGQ